MEGGGSWPAGGFLRFAKLCRLRREEDGRAACAVGPSRSLFDGGRVAVVAAGRWFAREIESGISKRRAKDRSGYAAVGSAQGNHPTVSSLAGPILGGRPLRFSQGVLFSNLPGAKAELTPENTASRGHWPAQPRGPREAPLLTPSRHSPRILVGIFPMPRRKNGGLRWVMRRKLHVVCRRACYRSLHLPALLLCRCPWMIDQLPGVSGTGDGDGCPPGRISVNEELAEPKCIPGCHSGDVTNRVPRPAHLVVGWTDGWEINIECPLPCGRDRGSEGR